MISGVCVVSCGWLHVSALWLVLAFQGVELLPWFVEFAPKAPESFRAVFADLSTEGVALMERCALRVVDWFTTVYNTNTVCVRRMGCCCVCACAQVAVSGPGA